MVYIVIYTIDNDTKTVVADNDQNLKDIIIKLEGIGRPKMITIYEAEQIGYKFTLEDKQEIIIMQVPKVDILK